MGGFHLTECGEFLIHQARSGVDQFLRHAAAPECIAPQTGVCEVCIERHESLNFQQDV